MQRPSRSRRAPGEWWADNTKRTIGAKDEEGLPLQPDEAYIMCDDPSSGEKVKYIGSISELPDGRYRVHYHGWAKRYDETLSDEQLRLCAPEWAAREARKRGRRRAVSTPSPQSQPELRHRQQRRGPATATKPGACLQRRAVRPADAVHRALADVARLVWGAEQRTLASSSAYDRDAVHRAYELLCTEHSAAVTLGRRRATDLAVAAAEVGHAECLRLVYERAGAEAMHRADADHRTAAQRAAKRGHDDCLRVIAECGGQASLSAATDTAGAPAHCAAQVRFASQPASQVELYLV